MHTDFAQRRHAFDELCHVAADVKLHPAAAAVQLLQAEPDGCAAAGQCRCDGPSQVSLICWCGHEQVVLLLPSRCSAVQLQLGEAAAGSHLCQQRPQALLARGTG